MVVSEELLILASCLLRPISRNSLLEEFSVRRFAVIQEEETVDLLKRETPDFIPPSLWPSNSPDLNPVD